MLVYTAKRILLMIPTLFGVAVLVFVMLRLMPGDIVELRMRAEGGHVAPEVIAQERARLGLDKPVIYQFGDWIGGLMVGDFGTSMWTGRPVIQEIAAGSNSRCRWRSWRPSSPCCSRSRLGTLSALFKNTWIDYVVRVFSIAGLAVPSFWLGMLIILSLLH
jgi:peptide/nickel transport system permease protein